MTICTSALHVPSADFVRFVTFQPEKPNDDVTYTRLISVLGSSVLSVELLLLTSKSFQRSRRLDSVISDFTL